ncbi:MAG: YggT family protein [Lachnospiraceae bacterium]|nr:YggT family protein [Lachnospiraceae bacterium]
MQTLLFVFTATVRLALYVIDLGLLCRAVITFATMGDPPDSAAVNFIWAITEPVILPFRILVSRSSTLSAMPIDMAFLFAATAVMIASSLIPPVVL